MPARALFVLLVMLNFGVATWWLLRPGPSAPVPWVQPDGVARLQLLGEAGAGQEAGAAGVDASAATAGDPAGDDAGQGAGVPPEVDVPAEAAAQQDPGAVAAAGEAAAQAQAAASAALRCVAFGPYADASSVAAARSALQPLGASRMRVRDVVDAPRGWSVAMAPQADRAAADALAAKIREAGFDDLLVIPSGDEANGIALGRYGGEAAARRREAALRAAGFPAQARPLGESATRHWLDVATGPGFDVAAARTAAAAAQVQDVDCAGIVDAAPSR